MKIDLGAAATAAWALFRRDRDVLLALTGMFLFLPTLATLLLIGPAPQRPTADAGKAVIDAWTTHYADWLSTNLPGIGAAALLAMLGGLSITAFYADRARPDVGSALAIGLRRLPAFFAQSLMLSLPASIGFLGLLSPALFILLLPGRWFLGRGLVAGVALVAEGAGPITGIRRSFALTRGNGLMLAGLAAIGAFGGELLAAPFTALADAMRSADAVNPVAMTLTNIGAAAVAAAVALAMILLRVTIYWAVADAGDRG